MIKKILMSIIIIKSFINLIKNLCNKIKFLFNNNNSKCHKAQEMINS